MKKITESFEEVDQQEEPITHTKSSRRALRSNRDLLLKTRLENAQGSNDDNFMNSLNNFNVGALTENGYSNNNNPSSYISSSNMSGSYTNQSDKNVDIKSINIGNVKNRKNQLSLSGVKNNIRSNDSSKLSNFLVNKNNSFSNNNASSRLTSGLLINKPLLDKMHLKDNNHSNTINNFSNDTKRRNKSYAFELTYHTISSEMPDTIYIDSSFLPGSKEGDLAELKTYTKKKPNNNGTVAPESFKSDTKYSLNTVGIAATSLESSNNMKNPNFTNANQLLSSSDNNSQNKALKNQDKKLFFIVKNFPDSYSRRTKNPQISLSYDDYHKLLGGLAIRSTVYVKIKDKKQEQCDLVELMAKDCYVNRGDMWLIRNKLNDSTVNLHQRLTFINSLRLSVTGIYKDGKKVFSGCINDDSKVIIRSESARFFFIIQITEEMWQFEEDGEVMFQKVVNSLFPKILKKWKKIGTNHNISIIFTATVNLANPDGEEDISASIPGYKSTNNKDYYRIVVDEVNITHWRKIMDTLRQEFMDFKKDLLNIKSDNGNYFIQGNLVSCVKTNILESINMVTTVLLNPFRQIDLRHTTTHVMIISPGAGLFDVDYELLKLTTKKLLSLEVTMDIICLSTPPMHIVPLLRYIDNNDCLRFCVPTWLSISFWNDTSRKYGDWKPTCKIYDLQVLNLTEDDFKTSSMLKDLPNVANIRNIDNFTKHYDINAFNITDETIKEEIEKTVGYFDMTKKIYIEHRDSISNASLHTTGLKSLDSRHQFEKKNIPKFILQNQNIQKPSIQEIDTIQVTASKDVLSKEDKNSEYSEAINTLKTVKSNSQLPKLAQKFSNLFYNKKNTSISRKDDYISNDYKHNSVIPNRANLLNGENPINTHLDGFNRRKTPILKKQQHKLFSTNSNSNNSSPMFRKKGMSDDYQDDDEITNHSRKMMNNNNKQKVKFQYDYWVDIENPSTAFDPERGDDLISQRWKDVYPKYFAKNTSKWRSFTTPADLPVTTAVCPTTAQYVDDYELRNYSVSLNPDIKASSLSNNDFVLIRNLIYARLIAGFQIIQNKIQLQKIEENYFKSFLAEPVTILNDENDFKNKVIYMLGNDEIHRICCNNDSVVEIRQYINKTDKISDFKVTPNIPMIKTRYESEYRRASLDPLNAFRPYVNWNQFDQYLAGYSEDDQTVATPTLNKFKSKFCVLSGEVSDFTMKSFGKDQLNSEEIRLEGLRKLIAVLYRLRVRSEGETKNSRKEEILPEIFFYTGSLQDFIMSQKDFLHELISDKKIENDIGLLSSKSPDLNDLGLTTKSELKKIAFELQYGDHKLNLCTRSWRWTNYEDTLIGSSLVNWLLKHFADIETREEAVSFGNYLMENGVIVHVLKNHGFLDGNYYYVIGQGFKNLEGYEPTIFSTDSGLSKKQSRSSLNNRKSPPSFAPLLSIKSMKSNNLMTIDSKLQQENDAVKKDDSSDIIALTPTSKHAEKPQIMLSSSLNLDLDPLKKSTKPQILTVHFDRAHNPDHCFHIRFEWVTTTPRLVDDLINNLSKTAESYGLKFVEIPWGEMMSVNTYNPFHSSVFISLALNPLTDLFFKDCDIIKENRFYFHMFFLEYSGFLLDNRGSEFFDKNSQDSKKEHFKFEIIYSWGKQTFKCAQFVHKTGAYIAEIIEDGSLFLAPNNIYLSRVNTSNTTSKSNDDSMKVYVDSQKVMLDFKKTCNNYEKLKEIFENGRDIWYSNKNKE